MADAVGRDLVDRGHELGGPSVPEPGGVGLIGDEAPHRREVLQAEGDLGCGCPAFGERSVEWRAGGFDSSEELASPDMAALRDKFVTPARLVDHLRVELFDVIRAQQPPRLAVAKGHVEQ